MSAGSGSPARGAGPGAGCLGGGGGDRGQVGRGEAQVLAQEGARDRAGGGLAAQPRLRHRQQLRRLRRRAQRQQVARRGRSRSEQATASEVSPAGAGGWAGPACRGLLDGAAGSRPDVRVRSPSGVRGGRGSVWARRSRFMPRARGDGPIRSPGPGAASRIRTMTSSWAMTCRGRPRSRWRRMKSRWKNEPRATNPPFSVTRPSSATHRSTGMSPAWRPQAWIWAGRSISSACSRQGRTVITTWPPGRRKRAATDRMRVNPASSR